MKHIKKLKLAAVHQLCNAEGKSTGYMLQLMQDACNVKLDACIQFIQLPTKTHQELFNEVNELLEVLSITTITKAEEA